MESRPRSRSGEADFWDFLPPVFVKELRQGLRANQFVWPFIAVQAAALTCVAFEFAARYLLSEHEIVVPVVATQSIFYSLFWIVFAIILPLTLFSALQPEVSRGRNIELLLLSNLSRWQIVLGKWFVGSTLSGLMLISIGPYWMVRYVIGNIEHVGLELAMVGGLIATNAVMNAVVIGASGFRNFVGRVFMIILGAVFSWLTFAATMGAFFAGRTPTATRIGWSIFVGIIGATLSVVLNLQLGRSRLRLFENPLDPPSTALIVVMILCAPVLIGITLAFTGGYGGWTMSLAWLAMALLVDPGPGKKQRKWAHA